jgi:hypothetical protein
MNAFDKHNLSQLENEIISVLTTSGFTQRYGLRLKFRGGNFNPNVATLRLELALPGQNGETPEELCFKQNCALYGIQADRLHKKFTSNGETWELTGMRDCRSKFKFFCKPTHGKTMLFTSQAIVNAHWLPS